MQHPITATLHQLDSTESTFEMNFTTKEQHKQPCGHKHASCACAGGCTSCACKQKALQESIEN